METESALLENLDRLHTTELGSMRIRRNLMLEAEDVVAWCRDCIRYSRIKIERRGKNWYIEAERCVITVNAYSYTIITAHRK